jgi:hypothetical protein
MAKLIPDAILDDQLEVIAAATRLYICDGQPATFLEASATFMLAEHTLTPVIGGGDFTSDDGDTSGRKLILAAQNGIEVLTTGDADHYALAIAASSTLLLVGTLTLQAVVDGNSINFPATDVDEIRDLA